MNGAAAGLTLKQASRLVGRNDAYLQQYLYRGSPRHLPEGIRWQLAELTGADQQALGMPDDAAARAARNAAQNAGRHGDEPDAVTIPLFDVRAAAGGGAIVQGVDGARGVEGEDGGTNGTGNGGGDAQGLGFPAALLHRITASPAAQLKLITITGDSMAPTLMDGDLVMIDGASTAPSPPGVFVLDDGVGLVAKRIDAAPNTNPQMLVLSSDNPAYATYERRGDEVRIAGRVVWFARKL